MLSRITTYLILSFALLQCSSTNEKYNSKQVINRSTSQTGFEKIKGAHVFGRLDSINIKSLHEINLNWITLVGWASQGDYNQPRLSYFRGDSSNLIKKDSAWCNKIKLAHQAGLKVLLKPHIWIDEPTDGKWRSDIFFDNAEDWEQWKERYREFILYYARIAQKNNVEMFCVGTELTRLTLEKPDFWIGLIKEIRAIYKGEITYAANWYKEYEDLTFWSELDYIGIQAYFPLATKLNPTVDKLNKAWEKWLPQMAKVHEKYNRKILFTEMGYKSTNDAAIEPWQWIEHTDENAASKSEETQANCYQSFFQTVWNQPWFTGVLIWQMRCDYRKAEPQIDLDFTPQSKKAEQIILEGFKS